MNTNNVIFILACVCIISVTITHVSAFEDGVPTCNRYVLNTYLYFVTYLLILTLLLAVFVKNNILKKMNLITVIACFVLQIAAFIAIMFVPKKYILLKHLLSIVFITLTSVIFTFIYEAFGLKSMIEAAVLVIIMFITLTIIAWKFQHLISSSVSIVFLIVFIVLIIAEFIMSMFFPSLIFTKIIILIILGLVCYLVLVKTKRMIENKETCSQDGGPDYVKESMGFVISVLNMITRILELKKGRRR